MAGGRPSKYKKAYCSRIVELAKQGLLPISWAADLQVSKQTLHQWRQDHPEFSDAFSLAKTISESEMTKRGIEGDSLDLAKAKYYLSAAFGVSEVQKQEVKQDLTAKIETVEVSFGEDDEV